MLPGQRAETLGAGAGNGFGQVELADRLVLAEVRTVVQFLQQHQLGALPGGLADALLDVGQIGLARAVVAVLDQGDGEGGLFHRVHGSGCGAWVYCRTAP